MLLEAPDDPFESEYSTSMHTKKVATSAASPATIPQ